MPAGTIALTNNSTTVSGNGTAFTSELKENDFIVTVVGGVTYTLGVKSVNSDTNVTLITKYDGPAVTGSAWTPVPNAALVGITAQVAADVAKAIRGYNLDKANWQGIYSDKASVTVTLPDLSTYTGPSWGYLATQYANKASSGANKDITSLTGLTTALSVGQGGTGQKSAGLAWKALLDGRTANTARSDLQLGSSATADVQSSIMDATPGTVLGQGAFGLGQLNANQYQAGVPFDRTQFWSTGASNGSTPNSSRFAAITLTYASNLYAAALAVAVDERNPTLWMRGIAAGNAGSWASFYTSANTTKSSDGTLKAASPVARIAQCQNMNERTDIDEAGFIWCGCGTANEEAAGISIQRFDAGVYILTGSAGLAKEGWQLLPPRDPQGSGDLGIVEAEETESGGLKITLYKRRYRLNDESGDIEVVKGELIDVPVNSWIDVRLNMPADSIYNSSKKNGPETEVH